jgi:hypothetical protein
MTGDYFEDVFSAYFQGQRDGYNQALDDVEGVITARVHEDGL